MSTYGFWVAQTSILELLLLNNVLSVKLLHFYLFPHVVFGCLLCHGNGLAPLLWPCYLNFYIIESRLNMLFFICRAMNFSIQSVMVLMKKRILNAWSSHFILLKLLQSCFLIPLVHLLVMLQIFLKFWAVTFPFILHM